MLLHVLGHVDPDHRLLVAEEELGEGAGELGLADPGGAEEDERAGRALRVLDPGARAADRFRDGGDRDLLADHPLVEFLLHADQFLGLGLGQLEDRDPGPHRDDVGDLFFADFRPVAVLALRPLVFELALFRVVSWRSVSRRFAAFSNSCASIAPSFSRRVVSISSSRSR